MGTRVIKHSPVKIFSCNRKILYLCAILTYNKLYIEYWQGDKNCGIRG
jgi:hypothetical protein